VSDARRALGRRGEALVAAQLAAWGWPVRATNWRCPLGELDIVAEDGDWLVIVEVRTRRGARFGSPEDSVGWRKQTRLIRLGQAYVHAVGWEGPWRIDVVAVEFGSDGALDRLAHYPNVTEAM